MAFVPWWRAQGLSRLSLLTSNKEGIDAAHLPFCPPFPASKPWEAWQQPCSREGRQRGTTSQAGKPGSLCPATHPSSPKLGSGLKPWETKRSVFLLLLSLAFGTHNFPSSVKDGNFLTHREKRSDFSAIAGLRELGFLMTTIFLKFVL